MDIKDTVDTECIQTLFNSSPFNKVKLHAKVKNKQINK